MHRQVSAAGGEYGRLRRVVVKSPREAVPDAATIARTWRDLNFTAAPDRARAIDEHDRFVALLRESGAEVLALHADADTTLDSMYVRDASVLAPRGIVPASMGKPLRSTEPAAQSRAFVEANVPVAGGIWPPGTLEGGDVVWFDSRTVAVGRGYRTNDDGLRQYRDLLGDDVDEFVVVPLPHWRGPSDVFHLMSIVSPVDRDLAVVYSPLMPVPFREWLADRGIAFVEVPDSEFESMGANVLAVGPRDCIMLAGNPETRAALERAGARVREYEGIDISLKGGGGPTCLTRPIWRDDE
jgi:N-dimethylarginine dimethylaminohydrolase